MTQYPNLQAAWSVFLVDQDPPQLRSDSRFAWEPDGLQAVSQYCQEEQLRAAEAELDALRQPGDLDNVDSPLWDACCGEEGSPVRERLSAVLNGVLETMFEVLGDMT